MDEAWSLYREFCKLRGARFGGRGRPALDSWAGQWDDGGSSVYVGDRLSARYRFTRAEALADAVRAASRLDEGEARAFRAVLRGGAGVGAWTAPAWADVGTASRDDVEAARAELARRLKAAQDALTRYVLAHLGHLRGTVAGSGLDQEA